MVPLHDHPRQYRRGSLSLRGGTHVAFPLVTAVRYISQPARPPDRATRSGAVLDSMPVFPQDTAGLLAPAPLPDAHPAPVIAVLVPCYNEEASIGTVVRDFRAALPDATIYVYDNNSR